jgi:antitoxin HigA-1
MMNMHNPAHPGELLTGWLDDLGVSVTAFAAHIGKGLLRQDA